MQPEGQSLTDFATWFIDSPLLALLLFAAALGMAGGLVWGVPSIRRTVAAVETTRRRPIDGLRGSLGIAVFAHHTVITWYFLHGSDWQHVSLTRFTLHLGQTSVALFFMITAFLFWGRVLARGHSIDWLEFFLSRLYRLYPVYLLMLGLVVTAALALTWSERHGFDASLLPPLSRWLLMLGAPDLNGLPDSKLLVAGVTWSLRYEWLFYLSLPFLACVAWRGQRGLAALLSAGMLAAVWYWLDWFARFDPDMLAAFLGGILAAHCVRSPRLAAIGRTTGAGLVAILALLAVVILEPTAHTWQAILELSVFFVIVASGHSFWGLLERPALLWLGEVTYSIYLLHGLLLWAVFQWVLPREASVHPAVFLASAVAVAGVLVLLSSIVFLAIERPAILLGKRHHQWLARTTAAHSADAKTSTSTTTPARRNPWPQFGWPRPTRTRQGRIDAAIWLRQPRSRTASAVFPAAQVSSDP